VRTWDCWVPSLHEKPDYSVKMAPRPPPPPPPIQPPSPMSTPPRMPLPAPCSAAPPPASGGSSCRAPLRPSGRGCRWPAPDLAVPPLGPPLSTQVTVGSSLPAAGSGLPLPVVELHPLMPLQRSVADGVSGMPRPGKPSQQQVGSASGNVSGLDSGVTGSVLPASSGRQCFGRADRCCGSPHPRPVPNLLAPSLVVVGSALHKVVVTGSLLGTGLVSHPRAQPPLP
jgi:hypothetical protein